METIDTVLVRDVKSGAEWYEPLRGYITNPIQGTVIIVHKYKLVSRPAIRTGPFVFRRFGSSTFEAVVRDERERFLRG
jgi:hypothetical protein